MSSSPLVSHYWPSSCVRNVGLNKPAVLVSFFMLNAPKICCYVMLLELDRCRVAVFVLCASVNVNTVYSQIYSMPFLQFQRAKKSVAN
jgi:hypothetical protein